MILEKERTMSKNKFIPDDFEIPSKFETKHFRLRMLSVDDVEKDYEAVMESQDLLHTMFGGSWPRSGFTLEENLVDLKTHQQEFLDREAFAYTVISLDESRVLGCVYINPSETSNLDAVVHMWVRQTEYDKGLDDILFNTVKDWIKAYWPFKNVDYPGRV
ncbi:MAG: GNAT family N-acetyltransferase [Promethearchaeota archaeon]